MTAFESEPTGAPALRRPLRVAVLGSHPIPYRTPLYRLLAQRPELTCRVFYGIDYGIRPGPSYWGINDFVWNADLTTGYDHVFLRNLAPRPHPSRFFGRINPGLGGALARFGPDAIIAFGYGAMYHVQGLLLALAMRVPILFSSDTNRLNDRTGLYGIVKRLIVGGFYRQVSAFLVTGTRHREHFAAFGVPEGRMFSFPWSVDNQSFRAQAIRLTPDRDRLRERYGIRPGDACVVSVGKLAPWKNVADLIVAAAGVERLFVLIVGAGTEEATLRALANDHLPGRHAFLGFLNQDALGEAYVAADFFAMPSRFEPWGLTCNEAMNFGLPLVVSDRVGAGADLVVPEKTGWIYPSGDPGALQAALERARDQVLTRRDAVRAAVFERIAPFNYDAQVVGVLAALEHIARETS